MARANEFLQLQEWAWSSLRDGGLAEGDFAGAILDEETGKTLEYRDLIKIDKYKEVWEASLTRE